MMDALIGAAVVLMCVVCVIIGGTMMTDYYRDKCRNGETIRVENINYVCVVKP